MAEIGSSTEESGLTPKQEQLIAALLAGNSIVVAAKAVGVGERTAHTWLKQPAFQSAYKQAKQEVFDERLEALRDGVDTAINTLKGIMTDEKADIAVRTRCAHIWLQQAIETHKMSNLEARIQELEEALKASRV